MSAEYNARAIIDEAVSEYIAKSTSELDKTIRQAIATSDFGVSDYSATHSVATLEDIIIITIKRPASATVDHIKPY